VCSSDLAIRTGTPTSDAKIDVLTDLVSEAAANSGKLRRHHLEGRSASRLER